MKHPKIIDTFDTYHSLKVKLYASQAHAKISGLKKHHTHWMRLYGDMKEHTILTM